MSVDAKPAPGDIIQRVRGAGPNMVHHGIQVVHSFLVVSCDEECGYHTVREINDGFLSDELLVFLPHFGPYELFRKASPDAERDE